MNQISAGNNATKTILNLLVLMVWSLAGCVANKTSKMPASEVKSATVLVAAYTAELPMIDGKIDRSWELAAPLLVTVREAFGGDNPTQVVLRALYTDEELVVLAEWPDSTLSDMRDPYIWNAESQQYDRPSRPDDQFAIEFPIDGDFEANMLTTDSEYTADVWHWKAALFC